MKKWIVLFLLSVQCLTISANEGTVVCIHGFMTTFRSMRPIEQSLKSIGFRVCSWDYPSRRRTIAQHACNLIPYLQQIACCHPGEPIDFVTHSTGALILRAALNIPGCPEEAKMGRAALLAPPNQGSILAHRFRHFEPAQFLMGSKSGWELMHYDSDDIECLGSFPPTMQVLVIAGTKGNYIWFCQPNDGFITVDETALDTPYYWTSFPVKHGDLISCPPVLCCLRTFLCWGYPEPESVCADPGFERSSDGYDYRYHCPLEAGADH